MLDERSLALLDVINGVCTDSGYKIFDLSELAEALSRRFNIDADGVRECVKNLSYHEYLSVKYEDEREICARPLSKGRLAFENRIDQEITRAKEKRQYFIYSALGGAIGSAVIGLIIFIVYALSGGA